MSHFTLQTKPENSLPMNFLLQDFVKAHPNKLAQ